jgi:excisionase family DNA binding protein
MATTLTTKGIKSDWVRIPPRDRGCRPHHSHSRTSSWKRAGRWGCHRGAKRRGQGSEATLTAPPPAQPSKRSGEDQPSASLVDVLSASRRRSDTTQSSTTLSPLLTARTVAGILGVCTETVLRWIRNDELPAIHLPGGAVRVPQDALNEWLRSRATPRRGVLATKFGAATGKRYPRDYDGGASYHGPESTIGPGRRGRLTMPQVQRGQAYRLGPNRWGLRYYDVNGVRRRKSSFPRSRRHLPTIGM